MNIRSSKSRASTLVYSTDKAGTCSVCGKALKACVCASAPLGKSVDGVVRLFRETKGRKGKGVTLVKGLPLSVDELTTVAKQLKSACGVGGSVKSGVIELQTADREKIKALLERAGFNVKIAGG
jgi:translation initiation factor 1